MADGARWARLGAGVVAASVLVFGSLDPTSAAQSDKYQVSVTDDFSSGGIQFDVTAMPTEAGNYKIGFFNGSIGDHVLVVVSLDGTGIDTVEEFLPVVKSVEEGGAEPPAESEFIGAVFSKPGQDHQRQMDLSEPGLYGYFCPIPAPSGAFRHYDRGFIGVFEVQ